MFARRTHHSRPGGAVCDMKVSAHTFAHPPVQRVFASVHFERLQHLISCKTASRTADHLAAAMTQFKPSCRGSAGLRSLQPALHCSAGPYIASQQSQTSKQHTDNPLARTQSSCGGCVSQQQQQHLTDLNLLQPQRDRPAVALAKGLLAEHSPHISTSRASRNPVASQLAKTVTNCFS